MKVKALSIRQPWAWLILHAGKDVENRNWFTHYRGTFLIHAAKGMTRAEYDYACDYAEGIGATPPPPIAQLERGGIVGVTELVECVYHSSSLWFIGRYGFVLRNTRPIPFTPTKGHLGFFDYDMPIL